MTLPLAVRRNDSLYLALIVLFALGLRIGYNLIFVAPGYLPELDAREYSDIASSLASGEGYRLSSGQYTAIRPPLFPLLLAGVYRLCGAENYVAGLTLEALLGSLVCAAAYSVARSLGGVAAGRISAFIVATYPLLIYPSTSLLSEPLFALLVTCASAAALRTLDHPRWTSYVSTGAWIGLAWLTRPNGAVLLPFVALWLLIASRSSLRTRCAGIALLVAVSLTVAAPWIVRNYLVMGKLIPTTTMSGAVLFGSNNERILTEPDLRGDWVSPCEVPGAGWTCTLDEIGRDEAWSKLGRNFIIAHLSDLPKMVWWRFEKFWHLYPFRHGFPEVVGHVYYVAVATFAIAGTWLLRRQWRKAGVLWSVVACFLVTGLIFWGGFRIRMPAEPALIALAAVALASTPKLVRAHMSRQQEC